MVGSVEIDAGGEEVVGVGEGKETWPPKAWANPVATAWIRGVQLTPERGEGAGCDRLDSNLMTNHQVLYDIDSNQGDKRVATPVIVWEPT